MDSNAETMTLLSSDPKPVCLLKVGPWSGPLFPSRKLSSVCQHRKQRTSKTARRPAAVVVRLLSPERYWREPRSQEVGKGVAVIPNATPSPR